MNNFIKIKMTPTKHGIGGSFNVKADFKLDNIQVPFNDIDNNIKYYLSYGVETGGEKHEEPKNDVEKMQCTAMKFEHTISEFKIDGVSINTSKIYLNYNRNGNILIGMDIMKDWDIHIGTTPTGETLFLACPQDQLNDEYFRELNRIFGIGDSIITAEVYND